MQIVIGCVAGSRFASVQWHEVRTSIVQSLVWAATRRAPDIPEISAYLLPDRIEAFLGCGIHPFQGWRRTLDFEPGQGCPTQPAPAAVQMILTLPRETRPSSQA